MTPFTPQELRKGFASFATGVTVITCLDQQSNHHGITISSFNTVSLDPPLILWSLNKRSRIMPYVDLGQRQLIHVLERSQEAMAMHFANVKENQFDAMKYQVSPSGLAKIDGCVAYYDCETVSIHEGGDHNIIIAKVVKLENHPQLHPLIFANSQFMGLQANDSNT